MNTSNRIDFLDALRSVLMILGIVLHSANIFTSENWAIQNSENSFVFSGLVDAIHAFRMPAFFIVSGFFCHLTLCRYKSAKFLQQRIPRIIIPLFMTALTVNLIQNVFLTYYNEGTTPLSDASYWLSGKWASHLWFLICLVYYFLIAAFLHQFFQKHIIYFVNIIRHTNPKYFSLLILVLPVASIFSLKVGQFIGFYEETYLKLYIGEALLYSPYFIVGYLIGYHRPLLKVFTQPPKMLVIASIALLAGFVSTQYFYLDLYVNALIPWLASITCFFVFAKFFDKPNKVFSYYSDASYSLYLFHHLLVILIGSYVVTLNLPIWSKFSGLVLSVFLLTTVIHEYLIKRSEILGYLYNGKRTNKPKSNTKALDEYSDQLKLSK